MRRKLKHAVLMGLGVGALGVVLSLIPFVLTLEENAELNWYFALRGTIEAPTKVVIIGIDEETAPALQLPDELDQWPRTVHAKLVDRLASVDASVIVFDISFAEARSPKDDQAFAEAIGRAGHVILLERIESGVRSGDSSAPGGSQVLRERGFPPISELQKNAIATAPFPLPVVPIRVNRFWSFSPTIDNPPTLPVVALQTFTLPYYTDFLTLLKEVRPSAAIQLPKDKAAIEKSKSVSELIREVRQLFLTDPRLATDLRHAIDQRRALTTDIQRRSALLALVSMYQAIDSPYLNFYGPPRSVMTVPFHRALQIPHEELSGLGLHGKAVFIGYSALTLAGQKDGYYSVFSQESGVHLSGAEIAATAFSNLLDRSSLEPLARPVRLSLVFLWGLVLAVSLCFISTNFGISLAVASGASYLAFASQQFASAAMWWPLIVPVLIQMPVALYVANRLQFTMERTEKEKILSNAAARLNPDLIRQLTLNVADLQPDTECEGVCLATDIQGFTNRVAQMERDGQLSEMSELMHEYWTILVRAVAQNGGFVRDFIGDSMVALWLKPEQFNNACKAALTMRVELDRFNRSDTHREFPTRVGMHFGRLRVGSIGTAGFGTEILGEPANIASRIESANKDLGTQVLVSGEVHERLEAPLVTRRLGAFLVAGKDESLQLYELVGFSSHVVRRRTLLLMDNFAAALQEFQQENWAKAADLFGTLHEQYTDDGPTRFYLSMSTRYAANGPDKNWNGIAMRLPISFAG